MTDRGSPDPVGVQLTAPAPPRRVGGPVLVRIRRELRDQAKVAAAQERLSLEEWLNEAVDEKLNEEEWLTQAVEREANEPDIGGERN